MPIRITQIEGIGSNRRSGNGERRSQSDISDNAGETTVLKVEGSLYQRDAELLEKICRDLGSKTQRPVTLDLASLNFLDSNSASVLCRLKQELGVRLEGLHLFIEKVVELAEEWERIEKYRPRSSDAAQT